MFALCRDLRAESPSSTVFVSTVLPRCQNGYEGSSHSTAYLQRWNADAREVNRRLREHAHQHDWIRVIEHPQFYTLFGVNKRLLSRDGLHLSFEGTHEFANNIDDMVRDCIPLKLQTAASTEESKTQCLTNNDQTITKPTSNRTCTKTDLHNGQNSLHKRDTNCIFESPNDSLDKKKEIYSSSEKTCSSKNKLYVIETYEKYILSSDINKMVGGGSETPFFSKSERTITHHEAADIMIQNIKDSITFEPPYRPEPGTIYLYDDSRIAKKKEDWRADGYTWRQNGSKEYSSEGKIVQRIFFKVSNQGKPSDKFQKHVFRFKGDDYNGRTVLVYFGDKEAYKSLPHGNRKKNMRQFKRTMPSVIDKIKNDCLESNPKEFTDKLISESSPDSNLKGIKVPRNSQQVRNLQTRLRREAKLSHDALYGLHLLVNQLDNFILSIRTTPDLEVVVGNSEIMDELNRLLQIKDTIVDLYYDTTFNLGDFYVSSLVCRHNMFKNKPIIPVAFMIHERKFQKCHEQFIDILKTKIPKLCTENVCVITDRETGIINAFENCLPKCKVFTCWNHILNDVKFWLSKHGGKNADKRVYDSQIRQLMHCNSLEDFHQKYDGFKQVWSEAFVNYFEENLQNSIINYAGRWILEPSGMYCAYSGITNNVAESLNAKLKRLIDYKEKSIDDIVLYLNYLQGNYHCELIRGFCRESEWTLKDEFSFAARDPDTVILPKNVCHPDKMLDLIKADIKSLLESKNPSEIHTLSDQKENSNRNELNEKGLGQNKNPIMSQRSLAVKTIAENGIVLVPQMAAFMVSGSGNNKYSVTLFPKESCSCPSSSRCYHIIAAMLSIGMDVPNDKKIYNLSQLRRNCRPKHSRKCGTKKGRIGDSDFEIIPAPDSVMKEINKTPCNTPKQKMCSKESSSKAKKNLMFDNSTPKTIEKPITPISSSKKRKNKEDITPYKVPKLDPDLSIIIEENELSQVDISSRDSSLNGLEREDKLWSAYLGLTNADIDCLKQNGKINSNHMEAVHKLLTNKFRSKINGFQLTEKVPVFCKEEKRWKTKIPMDAVQPPACQIHHNHNDHWVSSIYHNGSVYLLDSLGTDRPMDRIVPNGLKIQLSQIYGRNSTNFKVIIPNVMKQNNSIDCGLYAIAFVTSYCFRNTLCFELIYDSGNLRSHLLQCFENEEMSEFPLTKKTLSHRKPCDKKEITIENFCICNLPECVDTVMVQCDKCCVWYHRSCINAPMDISTADQEFVCGLC